MKDNNTDGADGVCPCGETCPIGNALRCVGGKWKPRIICMLYVDGTRRYNEILKRLPGITNTMLSVSLRELEADGIVRRKQFQEIPPRVEYRLTGNGRELWPALRSLAGWAGRNASSAAEGDPERREAENA